MESEKLASLQEKFKKIDEAAKLRAEEESNFINSTKENLEQKMKAHIDNRENIITDLKVKLSSHVSKMHINYCVKNSTWPNRKGVIWDCILVLIEHE